MRAPINPSPQVFTLLLDNMSYHGPRLSEDVLLSHLQKHGRMQKPGARLDDENFIVTDVFIAGSGPIAWVIRYAWTSIVLTAATCSATYASMIVEEGHHVYMAEIGSQDSRIVGEHHKNSIKCAVVLSTVDPC